MRSNTLAVKLGPADRRGVQVLELEAYACRHDLRELWHKLMTEMLLQRPEDPLEFMLQLLAKEKEAHKQAAS